MSDRSEERLKPKGFYKVEDHKIEKNNNEEISKVLDDIDTYKYCKTDILHKVNFESKMDKFIFDSLPLSNSQKEELLLSLYKV